ncbi:NADPH-dependent methylglyoxal reductase GRE2 [Apiospora marii]|uniref:NADPH-dependent methylglyoxal reductase GRE2 n=1 Tax=Apiospora marii TaxID=335849 RepID=A0ABR1RTW9_9PEZI
MDPAGLTFQLSRPLATPLWVFGLYASGEAEPVNTNLHHLSKSLSLVWGLASTKEVPTFDFGGFAHVHALEIFEADGQRFWLE